MLTHSHTHIHACTHANTRAPHARARPTHTHARAHTHAHQVLPPGLEISIDMTTGAKLARLPPSPDDHLTTPAAAPAAASSNTSPSPPPPPPVEGAEWAPAVRVADYDYDLPAGRIALHPARPRDSARLLYCAPPAGGGDGGAGGGVASGEAGLGGWVIEVGRGDRGLADLGKEG
jgi:hypothetical protein